MSLIEKQHALVASLANVKDAQERFAWLVRRGQAQPPLAPELKCDAHRVEGCLAVLWFVAEVREARCFFLTDSDSLIVKGIAGVLSEFYSGATPREIVKLDPSFLGRAGIDQLLTPNRRNSLSRVWEKIHAFASAQLTEHDATLRCA